MVAFVLYLIGGNWGYMYNNCVLMSQIKIAA